MSIKEISEKYAHQIFADDGGTVLDKKEVAMMLEYDIKDVIRDIIISSAKDIDADTMKSNPVFYVNLIQAVR